MTPRLSRLVPAVAALAALTALSGCGSSSGGGGAGDSGSIQVVAAENFWGDIAKQIGGSHVDVTSIISDPSADPHLYESDPRTAAQVSSAQLVIDNGLGYDDFIDKILGTGGSSGRRVLSVQKVLRVSGSNANPHLWYWTARLPEVAAAIAGQLSAIDPAHRAAFHAGAEHFDASLKPLLSTIATIKRKYGGTKIAYTERVPGYLVEAAGLVLGTPASFSQAIEDGNDPSPQDASAFDSDITTRQVKVLLYNSQVVDAQTNKIKQLAISAGIPVVGVSETVPPEFSDFQAWQLHQDRALLEALGG
ncbi:MAG TPA: zinc ABC transporter substrate-binding protein [Mycobacteriales bacterium]|nr:zinc ABC transporter substrate-binding protein [Mycobacteriales bacterium]